MALFNLTKPPRHLKGKPYKEYKSWLSKNFFLKNCAYCWESVRATQIDHYIPKSFRKDLKNDPKNLLLTCGVCNGDGPIGKWDYHPSYVNRKRFKSVNHGFHIHNIVTEDISTIFKLNSDGKLVPKSKAQTNRAQWLIAVFDLNHHANKQRRYDLIKSLELIKRFERNKKKILKFKNPDSRKLQTDYNKAINEKKRYKVFYKIFEL